MTPDRLAVALEMARDPEAVIKGRRASECPPHPFGQDPELAPGICWCHASADAPWHLCGLLH